MDDPLKSSSSGKSIFPHNSDASTNSGNPLFERPDADKTSAHLLFEAALLDQAPDPIMGTIVDGTIITWNRRAENVLGYTAQEMRGQSITSLFPPGYEGEHAQLIERAQHGEHLIAFQTRRRCKDDCVLDVALTASPVRDSTGALVGLSCIVRDITSQKQIEEELQSISRFPAENPNPILRVSNQGVVLYANKASRPVLNAWGCQVGDTLPLPWGDSVAVVVESGHRHEVELDYDDSTFLLEFMPIADNAYVNIYGRDITTRRQSEDALKESEARFRQLANSMPQLVWTARPDGTIDYINQRYQEYADPMPMPDGGWHWEAVVHPDDVPSTREIWLHALQTGETYQMEHRVGSRDGTFRWHLSRAVPVRDGQGRVVRWYGATTGIHQRKVAEERMALLQSVTADLSKSTTLEEVAAVVVNKALNAAGGHIGSIALVTPDKRTLDLVDTQGLSQTTTSRFQHTPLDFPSPLTDAVRLGEAIWIETQEEYIRRYPAVASIVTSTTHSHATACLPLTVGDLVMGGVSISFPYPVSFSQDDRDFLLALGRQCAQAIQRAQLYEVAMEERNKLWTLLDSMTEEVWFCDTEGNIGLLNQAAVNGLGLDLPTAQPLTERLGRLELGHAPDEPHAVDNSLFARSFRNGETLKGVEIMAIDPHTEERRIRQANSAPITDETGNIIGAVVVARDITDQKRVEQQTRDLLAERERIRVLAEFVHNISHDFKTPLSTLHLGLHILSKLPDAEKQRHQIAVLTQQTKRLADLIEGTLKMTRLDHDFVLEVALTNLNQLVSEIFYGKLSAAERRGLTTQLYLSEEALDIQADAVELEQALLNVLNNALEFTPAGGVVTIQTSRQDTMAVVEIHDTGIGISPTDLPHIFERLYRSDKARGTQTGGIGLGLSIAQKILHLHGGDIEVSSSLGEGTTVRVLLPLT
jgi:PAS domain S-box-containing protein